MLGEEQGYLHSLQEAPHKLLARYKGTNSNLIVESLVDTTLTNGSKLTSLMLGQTNRT